jgi:hypothetical protein
MGTTNTTTGSNQSTLQFNPQSQALYNQLTQGGGNVLSGFMNNPFGNANYRMGAAQSQAGAQAAGANNMGALNQAMLTGGLTGQAGAGFGAAQRAQTGRANQAMSSQANVSNVLSALQRQMTAAGTGLSFSPQLTGQSGNFQQQQSTGGLGTWLPQLLGGLGGAAMGMMNQGQQSGGAMTPGAGASSASGAAPFGGGFNMPSNSFSGFPGNIMQGGGGQMPGSPYSMFPLGNPFGQS